MDNSIDKKVAIHQPNYLPWIGYFNKMACADVFIILDTAQFTKNSYQNRVKIKTQSGAQWLSQPVRLADGAFKPTNEIRFADNAWKKKHIKTLQMNYARASYFSRNFPHLFDLFENPDDKLSSFNTKLICWMAERLGINTPIVLASDCPSGLTRTDRLIELIRWVGGTVYLSGGGGPEYQNESLFQQAGIKLEVLKYNSSPYSQLWGEFIPGLSIMDFIFNCGAEGRSLCGF